MSNKNKTTGAIIFALILFVLLGFLKLSQLKTDTENRTDSRFKSFDGAAFLHFARDKNGDRLCLDAGVVDFLIDAYEKAGVEPTVIAKDIINDDHGHICK